MNYFENTQLRAKDYFLCFILIAISGINNFGGYVVTTIVVLLVLLFNYKKVQVKRFFIIYVLFILALLMFSGMKYSHFQLTNYLSLFMRIFAGYLLMYLLNDNFIRVFIKTIYFFGVISLFFWSLFVLFPSIEQFFYISITPYFDYYLFELSGDIYPAPNFIIYTMNHWGVNVALEGVSRMTIGVEGLDRIFMRNSMCFGEPSIAMLFVIPAFFLNTVIKKGIINKINIVFLLVVLTSWSTGGFVVIFFIIIGWAITQRGGKNIILILPLAIISGYYSFIHIDAFGRELTDKVIMLQEEDLTYAARTRLVNAVLDFNETLNHPLTGKGFFRESKNYMTHEWRTNGSTFIMNKYGFIGFILYFLLMYRYFNLICIKFNANRTFAIVMIASIIFIGFGNKLFEKPLFFGLTMLYNIIVSKQFET